MNSYYKLRSETNMAENLFFAIFLCVDLWVGVILYDVLPLFQYADELASLLLLVMLLRRRIVDPTLELRPVMMVLGIFAFYLAYSFVWGVNTKAAAVNDMVVQLKPLLGFFCTYALLPYMNDFCKNMLKMCVFFSFAFLVLLTFLGSYYIELVLGHLSRFATAVTLLSVIYLFISEFTWKTIITVFFMMALGLASGRSKFFGFYFLMMSILVLSKKGWDIRLNFKTLSLFFVLALLSLAVVWSKFNFYFIEGAFDEEESFARPALYYGASQIFLDYFPFGSGFGSFATFFSGKYYSPIYNEYGLDHLWGLTPEEPKFIADTYYPSLAQFGVVGVVLFCCYFAYIYRQAIKYKSPATLKYYLIVILGIVFFIVESTTDSTFTQNRGLYFFMIIGCALSQMRYEYDTVTTEQNSVIKSIDEIL